MRLSPLQLVLLIVTLIGSVLFSQSYLVHQYSEINGLPSSVIKDVAQDENGRIWVATRSGISVYDGADWKNYGISDGLPVSNLHTIKCDSLGNVWTFSYSADSSIWKYDGYNWTTISIPSYLKSEDISYTAFEIAVRNGRTLCAVSTIGGGVFIYEDESWTQLTTDQGLLSDTIYCMANYRDRLYFGTNKGLSILRDNKIQNWSVGQSGSLSPEITGIAVQDLNKFSNATNSEPVIWLKSDRWIGYLQNSEFNLIKAQLNQTYRLNWINGEFYTSVLQPDYLGGLYWGNLSAVYHITKDGKSIQYLNKNSGLIGEGSTSMLIDHEMNLWIGGLRGLNKLPNRRFANYQKINGLLEDEVTAVVERSPGQFVFGHNSGITHYNGAEYQTVSLLNLEHLPPGFLRVMDLEKDDRGNVWAALQNYGVALLEPDGNITFFGKDKGLQSVIYSTFVDSQGDVFAGGTKGIYIYRAGSFHKLATPDFTSLVIRAINQGPGTDLLLMTTYDGLLIGRPERWRQIVSKKSKYNSLYCGLVDSRGQILVGSAAGLLIAKDSMLVKYNELDFQIDRPVYFLVEDLNNNLWVGTDNGAIRWDGEKARKFTVNDGLVGLETNRAAGLLDSRGRIWIGTDGGISLYQEESDNINIYPPRVELSSINADDLELSIDEDSYLKHDQSNLNFHFSIFSYIDEQNILVKRQLVGLDTDWQTEVATPIRKISYFSLPPGQYYFKMRARNAAGIWSKTISSPKINILPPFWLRWWFFIMCFFVITGAILTTQSYFNKKHFADRLQVEVDKKTGELEQSREQYSQLFELCPLGVAVYDHKGDYLYVNPAYCKLLMFEISDLVGKNYIDIKIPPENQEKERDLLATLVKDQPRIEPFTSINLRSDGKTLTVRYHGDYTRDPGGQITGFVVFGEDVTERQLMENQLRQAQKMEAIGQLAGGIAHDFNNLLAAIVGYSELGINKTERGSPAVQYFNNIIKRSDHGAKLVNHLLAFSRKQPLNFNLIDLNDVVSEASKFLRQVIGEDIELDTKLDPDLATITADSTALNQIITNLCINARDAMPKGGKLIIESGNIVLDENFCNIHKGAEPGDYVKLLITDTGKGMDEETRKQIFDPFFTTKAKWEGAGLGLSMIFGLMKQHNGYIDCNSELGKGTTFKLYFPVAES